MITREQIDRMCYEGYLVSAGEDLDTLYYTYKLNTKRFEREEIKSVLERVGGNILKLAEYMQSETEERVCDCCNRLAHDVIPCVSGDHTGHLRDYRGNRVCDTCCEELYSEEREQQ